MRRAFLCTAIYAALTLGGSNNAQAELISFSNQGQLEGQTNGSTASYTMDGVAAVLTTVAISPSNAVLNPNDGTLGINAPGGDDSASAFDDGESWTFSWDIDTFLLGINFGSLTSSETFLLQSNSFQGLSVTPTNTEIAFASGTGTFTFGAGTSSDSFTLTDLSNDASLFISANTPLVLSYSGTGSATLESMTFTNPEPPTMILTALGLLAIGLRQRMVEWRMGNREWRMGGGSGRLR